MLFMVGIEVPSNDSEAWGIDAIVEANRMKYKDRSNFISVAASHEIQRGRSCT